METNKKILMNLMKEKMTKEECHAFYENTKSAEEFGYNQAIEDVK